MILKSRKWESEKQDSGKWESGKWESGKQDSGKWNSKKWNSKKWESEKWDSEVIIHILNLIIKIIHIIIYSFIAIINTNLKYNQFMQYHN